MACKGSDGSKPAIIQPVASKTVMKSQPRRGLFTHYEESNGDTTTSADDSDDDSGDNAEHGTEDDVEQIDVISDDNDEVENDPVFTAIK